MKIQKKIQNNGIVEYMIHDETHTLLRSITESLRKHPEVSFVSYVKKFNCYPLIHLSNFN